MKSLLVISCLFVVAAVVRGDFKEEHDAVKDLMKDEFDACADEIKFESEDEQLLVRTDLEGEEKLKVGCFNMCWMKKMGSWADGEFKFDNMKEHTEKILEGTPEKVPERLELLKSCAEEVKDKEDECEIGYEFSVCLLKNLKV